MKNVLVIPIPISISKLKNIVILPPILSAILFSLKTVLKHYTSHDVAVATQCYRGLEIPMGVLAYFFPPPYSV